MRSVKSCQRRLTLLPVWGLGILSVPRKICGLLLTLPRTSCVQLNDTHSIRITSASFDDVLATMTPSIETLFDTPQGPE